MPCYHVCYRFFRLHLGNDRYPPRLGENRRVLETGVLHRRRDRSVPQQLLKGGEATTALQPRTSERVPALMDVEPLDPAAEPDRTVEMVRVRERVEPPHAAS